MAKQKKTTEKEVLPQNPNQINMVATPPPLARKRKTEKYTFQPFNDHSGSRILCYRNTDLCRAIFILPYFPSLHKWDEKKVEEYLEKKMEEWEEKKKK